MVCQFYLSSQETSFWLWWFLLWSLLFFCIYFCPNFLRFLSFYLPWGSSFLPFLVALGVELGYLFDFFVVSWGMPVLLWSFPLALFYSVPQVWGCCVFIFNHFYAYFDLFFYFFCDLLVIQQHVVQPPYVGIFNSFSPVIEI